MKGVKSADSYFTIELTATMCIHLTDGWMELSKCNWVAKVTPFKPTMKPPTHDATLLCCGCFGEGVTVDKPKVALLSSAYRLVFNFCFYLLKGDT